MNPSECEMTINSSAGDVKINTWCKLIPSGELPDSRVGHTGLYYKTDHKVSRAIEWYAYRNRKISGNRTQRSNKLSVIAHHEAQF
jgi:hypothetical protein